MLATKAHWSEKSIMRRPTKFEARMDCLRLYIDNLTPCCNSMRINANCNSNICSRIIGLLSTGSPTTILKRVIPIGINTINGFPFWSFPHVTEEILKRLPPPRADTNPTTAVVWICIIIGVFAAFYHLLPKFIYWCVGHAVRCAVNCCALFSKASTRLRLAAAKAASADNRQCFAAAQAFPVSLAVTVHVRKFLYHKTTKRLVEKIKTWGHGILQCIRDESVRAGSRRLPVQVYIPSAPNNYNIASIYKETHHGFDNRT